MTAETGAMRTLLISPFPRWFLLSSKLIAQRRGLAAAGLCLPADRLFLGDRAAAARLSHGDAGAVPLRA